MPPIDLVLYAAGGALCGAALTVAIQVLLTRIRHRHNKDAITIDARLALYADFLNTLDRWSVAGDSIRRLRADPDVTGLAHVDDEVSRAIEDFRKFVSGIPTSPELSSEQIEELESEAQRRKEELKRLGTERDACVEKVEAKVSEMVKLGGNLKHYHDRLIEISGKLNLIAGRDVIRAMNVLIGRAAKSENPSAEEYEQFRAACEKELKAA